MIHYLKCFIPFNVWYIGSGPSAPSSSVTSPSHMNVPAHAVPDFSYSSSEDEFYDADEYYQSSASPKHCIE